MAAPSNPNLQATSSAAESSAHSSQATAASPSQSPQNNEDHHEEVDSSASTYSSEYWGPPMNVADNYPPRHELFILGDGEKKIIEEADTSQPNTSRFTINKEDHTLGNLVAAKLHHYPYVLFSGYNIPHPSQSVVKLRVQTDGSITPKAALVKAMADTIKELDKVSREFTKEYELRKMVGGGANGGPANGDAAA